MLTWLEERSCSFKSLYCFLSLKFVIYWRERYRKCQDKRQYAILVHNCLVERWVATLCSNHIIKPSFLKLKKKNQSQLTFLKISKLDKKSSLVSKNFVSRFCFLPPEKKKTLFPLLKRNLQLHCDILRKGTDKGHASLLFTAPNACNSQEAKTQSRSHRGRKTSVTWTGSTTAPRVCKNQIGEAGTLTTRLNTHSKRNF